MIKLRTLSRKEDALRIVVPLAIIMLTTITWAGERKYSANNSLLAMSAQRRADILGKIAGEGCKGNTAFYQGTMKDIPQPEGDRRPQLPVPPANENDTFWNVMCKNGRSYSIEVHPDGSNNVVECDRAGRGCALANYVASMVHLPQLTPLGQVFAVQQRCGCPGRADHRDGY